MKTLLRILVLTFFVLALAAPASADAVRGEIPFSFVVMDRELPAGQYTITVDAFSHRVVVDNGFDQRSFALFAVDKPITDDQRRLTVVFHKYGDKHFLRQVNCTTTGVDVLPSKEEKWVRRAANDGRGPKMALVRVALR